MIVEDSRVVRELLTAIIGRDPRLQVAGAFTSAEEALAALPAVQPDVISMDICLPGMSGLDATRRIMAEQPRPIVVIADSAADLAGLSMNALRAGALSVVEKPIGLEAGNYEEIAGEICTQLAIMSEVRVIRQRPFRSHQHDSGAAPPEEIAAFPPPSAIGIAASTGGPPALARVLGALPADFPVPIFLVQHMGARFMEGFATWLDGLVPLNVAIAEEGVVAQGGNVYVAPGAAHLTVAPGLVIKLDDGVPVDGQKPSATTLFRSLAQTLGSRALGVLLTGMGEDGARGLVDLRKSRGFTIAEDETTSVVYGMPGAAARLGGVSSSLPLDAIAGRILAVTRIAQ
jgi:two-component system chemotaxis response regulator CheB